MKFVVNAIALNPETGEAIASPRHEKIDTETNVIFEGCRSPWEVEDAYEAFWNRLNASWEYSFPSYKEKVKVLSVVEI